MSAIPFICRCEYNTTDTGKALEYTIKHEAEEKKKQRSILRLRRLNGI